MTALLEVNGLTKHYPAPGNWFGQRRVIHALDDVSFTLEAGETLALVGESGCGKSTLARALMRLTEPTAGSAVLDGIEIAHGPAFADRAVRRKMQMVFQ